MIDAKAFGEELAAIVKAQIGPIAARLDVIERRLDALPAPCDGKDADTEDVRRIVSDELAEIRSAVAAIGPAPELPDITAMIDVALDARGADPISIGRMVRSAVDSLPPPKSGRDGADGTSVTIDDVLPALEKRVAEYLDEIPRPKDGASVTLDDVQPMISAEIERRMGELPKAKDGRDGTDGENGRDGLGLAGAFIDRDGELVITLSNGEVKKLGAVVGKDGEPGKPGRDGFNLEDFDATVMDDGRTVLLSFERGDLSYKVELGFPVMLYRGVYREDSAYERGDTVTWGGSLWHLNADRATEKPGDGSREWTLAAKKGRDGRDGVAKEAKPHQPVRVGVPAEKMP
jgi:hypothetical protein